MATEVGEEGEITQPGDGRDAGVYDILKSFMFLFFDKDDGQVDANACVQLIRAKTRRLEEIRSGLSLLPGSVMT